MTRPALQFDFEWRISLFTALLLPLFISLGFWQLQRAEEKRVLAASHEERQRRAPVQLTELAEGVELAYLPVALRGSFDNERMFLLDNRIHKGRFGYEVVAPVQLDGMDGPVLVNRGWIAGDSARRELPRIPPVEGRVSLRGHIYLPPGEAYLLAEQQLEDGWPKRLQAVDVALISEALGQAPGFPHLVRVDAGQPGALAVDWQIINISPEKHTGYAVQWFTMAAALLILFILRSSNLWQVLRGHTQEGSTP